MIPTTTYAGYPQGARVIQQPTAYTGATTISSGATTIASQPRQILQQAPIQSMQAPRTITTGAPVTSGGVRQAMTTAMPTSGYTQARVISSGTATMAPQPMMVSAGQRQIVSQGAYAPRIVQAARPATVQSTTAMSAQFGMTQGAYETKHKDDPQLQNLKELRKTCGLKDVAVGDALKSLKSMSVDGQFTRDQFLAAYQSCLQQNSVAIPSAAVQNAVFDLFDRDDNGVVDMMELICGASLLCTGTEEDKIHAVFDVFDENGDGVISMDEMFKFLTSVFKVVLTPNVMDTINSMGVTVESPEDLASVTALECFKTADLDHDGRLSVGEFKNWFFAPRNDPSFLFSPVRKMLA